MAASNIDKSEWDDFHGSLSKYRRDETEFNIQEQVQPHPVEPSFLRGTVTVKAVKTAIEKTYRTGTGSTWVAEFQDDMRSGFFGG